MCLTWGRRMPSHPVVEAVFAGFMHFPPPAVEALCRQQVFALAPVKRRDFVCIKWFVDAFVVASHVVGKLPYCHPQSFFGFRPFPHRLEVVPADFFPVYPGLVPTAVEAVRQVNGFFGLFPWIVEHVQIRGVPDVLGAGGGGPSPLLPSPTEGVGAPKPAR